MWKFFVFGKYAAIIENTENSKTQNFSKVINVEKIEVGMLGESLYIDDIYISDILKRNPVVFPIFMVV